jgi:hypothetical protein
MEKLKQGHDDSVWQQRRMTEGMVTGYKNNREWAINREQEKHKYNGHRKKRCVKKLIILIQYIGNANYQKWREWGINREQGRQSLMTMVKPCSGTVKI